MNELLDFKRRLKAMELCGPYTEKWNNAKTKLDLVELATDANGCPLMADATAFGFGLPLDYITREFGEYINGKALVMHDEGYSSTLWVGQNEPIEPHSTLVILLGCNCKVTIPEGFICRLFVAKSDIEIENNGVCEVEQYGICDINLGGKNTNQVTIRLHTSSEWKK